MKMSQTMFLTYNLSTRYFRRKIKEKYVIIRQYNSHRPYKLLFFGSDNISLTSFQKVNDFRKKENCIDRLDLVVTNINSKNRTQIEKYAQEENIKTILWPLNNLQNAEYDLGLIVAFGHLIKADLLNKFPLGMVNVHPSLLPRWRGAAPIIHTILHGDSVTGVTLMKIKADIFDVGEIISQRKVPVPQDVKLPELTEQLSNIGAEMLVDCLRTLPESLDNAYPQSNDGVTHDLANKSLDGKWSLLSMNIHNSWIIDVLPTHQIGKGVKRKKARKRKALLGYYSLLFLAEVEITDITNLLPTSSGMKTKKINKTISEVRWHEMTARDVYNLYRATYGLYPLSTKFRDKHLKLFDAFIHNPNEVDDKPVGYLEYCSKTDAIRVLCKDKKYIHFRSLRIVGKRQITALDFYNGYIKNMTVEEREHLVLRN